MSRKEMVSIILPTYNREKVIGRAIQSILRQTYENYEIIIVDDGSTDHTQEIIEQMKDDRIRYIRLEQNQGVGHARNIGIQEAKYDYIAFCDSDDEWFPDKLQKQMEKLLGASEHVGLVYCRVSGTERYGNNRYIWPPEKWRKDMLEGNIFQSLLMRNTIANMSILARKECLVQAGGFHESLRCLEDWEFFLRISRDWMIEMVDEILLEAYPTEGSVSTNVSGFLITRCYMVSRYRKEMTEMGIIEDVKKEILAIAEKYDIYAVIAELLTRDFEL